MQTPTVSVVIPAYNHASYLRQTIASALAQTWRDFETIVIDDGSTDNTAEVAASFGDAIRYIRQANRGIAGARNTGIKQARGEFISLLDDDDLWEPDYLESVIPIFRQYPDTMAVHTGWQGIDKTGRKLPARSTTTVPPAQTYETLIAGGFFTGACVTIRKTCLDQVGLFDETLQGCDDLDLWLRISRTHTFRGVSKVLVLYRMHEGGLSANGLHMFRDYLKVISKHFGPCQGDPLEWPDVKRYAYGLAYRWGAFAYIQQGQLDEGWQHLRKAVQFCPKLLGRLDTFYELACGDQPREFRGIVRLMDIERNGLEMLSRLDALFAELDPNLKSIRRSAYGNAHLAMGMLSDQAGQWASARRHLFQAVKFDPRFLCSYYVVRRLLKLRCGKRLVSILAADRVR
jgi:glycosyltransferase involved in cell wall biosynthesis